MLAAMGLVVTLLVIGAVLLILEVFLPGMIAGLCGLGCLVAAVVMSYVEFGAKGGNLALLLVTLGVFMGFMLWVRYFPDTPMARPFVSRHVIGNVNAEQPELLQRTGTAVTQLRPSGTASIEGRRVDVVTEGGLIEKGTAIKVVAIEGMRVVVRELSIEELQKYQAQGYNQSS